MSYDREKILAAERDEDANSRERDRHSDAKRDEDADGPEHQHYDA